MNMEEQPNFIKSKEMNTNEFLIAFLIIVIAILTALLVVKYMEDKPECDMASDCVPITELQKHNQYLVFHVGSQSQTITVPVFPYEKTFNLYATQ